ncbi:MAG: RNA methyltransferase [Verrucomicrobia bacterium]|nr:RNA methyltransferase [Verrucomicrobiota bacterium]
MSAPVGSETGRPAAWGAAARLIARWLDQGERIDALLDGLPPTLTGAERARCQHLVLGVVRHFGRMEVALQRLVAHPPRFTTRAALCVAAYELIEAASGSGDTGQVAKIVHHAVEQTKALASLAEARLVNAVVRKLIPAMMVPPPPPGASAAQLAEYFSHPEWLVRGWLGQFGPEATRSLLEWNQRPATVYARWRDGGAAVPPFLKPTRWNGFFEVESGHWREVEPLLKEGKLYLQDPGTRLAVELLAPQPGETVLDLCAAPGGKSLLIADVMKAGKPASAEAGAGKLVAMDLPGTRIDRLKQNLARAGDLTVALVQADVTKEAAAVFREHHQPENYAAVLIDVPCSNTGVIRHRADVKWRLQEGDLKKHPHQQLTLLHAAARLVAPGGRLVYSTCSLEAAENDKVVADFLRGKAGEAFTLEASAVSQPWVTGHDGAGAFLLRRKG